ncbi:MAG: YifB family Mg chelatase-like AAA ATPase [Verrucomicrobiae bacterium]|nr:YifB family Mg chelatase-like AAA ATPase [Verrucomicrobiae bacterium]
MLARCFSAAITGLDASVVEVEVNTGQGLPQVVIVGLPDKAVNESRDRVKTALENSGFRHVRTRTTINLAPADVKKEGPIYDLPMALGILAATEQAAFPRLGEFLVVGELALNGAARRARGVLSMALLARARDRAGVIVPIGNVAEASVVKGIEVYGVASLRECAEFLSGKIRLEPRHSDAEALFAKSSGYDLDFSDVKGQTHAKRAVEVAVAGGHNVLMIGPPGSGKSMIAKRIPSILPPMTLEEALETTRIHSVAGLLAPGQALVAARPFRSPHHTISDVALTGGTADLRPGEVSLAHHGVLFLDELPEFKRAALEAMRQPIEDGSVNVARATGTVQFPCRFMLVASMNPCPCGFLGNPKKECRCSPSQVQKYRAKISGPLLDRVDLHVEVPSVSYGEIAERAPAEPSEAVRMRVVAAREFQYRRFRKRGRINAHMTPKGLRAHCALDAEGEAFLRAAMEEMHFSARAHDRILKVARTIADLEGSERLASRHLGEALQYRSLDRAVWS